MVNGRAAFENGQRVARTGRLLRAVRG
jgi:hypothetical protein